MKKVLQSPGGAVKTSLFAAEEREAKLDKQSDPLQAIDNTICLKTIANQVDELCPRTTSKQGGRPPYPTEVMVRVLLIQHLYNLSDEAMEYQLLDRLSFQRFCLLRDSSTIPDRTTIWQFRQRIGTEEGAQGIFDAVQQQLSAQGFMARGGQLIDASIVTAPIQHIKSEDKAIVKQTAMPIDWTANRARQKDVEAKWTKKHNKSHFGYKLHTNVDNRGKFIRQISVTPANEADTKHFEGVLDPANTSKDVYADKGYIDQEREQRLTEQGYRMHIQRKAKAGKKLSETQAKRNRRIAKPRARVEHIFASLSAMGGKQVRSIGLRRAQIHLLIKSAVYNMSRLVSVQRAGLKAF